MIKMEYQRSWNPSTIEKNFERTCVCIGHMQNQSWNNLQRQQHQVYEFWVYLWAWKSSCPPKHSKTIWKSKKSSDQNPQQNETCFEYPRSKPAQKLKIKEQKVYVFSSVSMKLLVPLTTKTNARNWTTNWNWNVTYVANFCVRLIKNQPNMYVKIALLKTNKHLLVIYTITFNAL